MAAGGAPPPHPGGLPVRCSLAAHAAAGTSAVCRAPLAARLALPPGLRPRRSGGGPLGGPRAAAWPPPPAGAGGGPPPWLRLAALCPPSRPVAPAAAAPRWPPLRRGRPRPGAASPAPGCGARLGGRGSASAVLRPALRGWAGLAPLRRPCAPSSPPRVPPALPGPCGGRVGAARPRGSSRPGAAGRPFGPLGSAAAPGLWVALPPHPVKGCASLKKTLDRVERLCYHDGAGPAQSAVPAPLGTLLCPACMRRP